MAQSRWAVRFLGAALINGAFGFGIMGVLLYLAVFGRPAASRIVASGGAGIWFIVGIIGYGLVGILGIAVASLFYQYLEATLKAPYRGWRNYAAWAHLTLGVVGGSAAALLMAYGGYLAGAAMLPTSVGGGGHLPSDPASFAWVHENILGPLALPIAALIGVALLGHFIGGVGYATSWWSARGVSEESRAPAAEWGAATNGGRKS